MRAPLLVAVLLASSACRPDPGVPDYSSLSSLFGDGGVAEVRPGPFPYVTGARRAAFGVFYEGGASDRLPIDSYFIFSNSYATQPSDDRVEGLQSDQLDFNGTAFWGGGLFWNTPTNLTGWTTLHVSLRSSDPGLATIAVRVLYFGPAPGNAELTVQVKANDYGWVNDGAWHSLSIPLADFSGLDVARVRSPFTIGNDQSGGTARTGESLLVDDVYLD
ncbi:MAG: hypothetical protein Q8N26_17185 [Myxococcales bacterium]|nr:hypothetical protein [Myxococcales bacterium]